MNVNITDPIFHDEDKAVEHIFPVAAGRTESRLARTAGASEHHARWVAKPRPVTGFATTAATSSLCEPARLWSVAMCRFTSGCSQRT